MYKTNVYSRWSCMKQRCARDPKYIAKGITVCARWLHSFENFYADMGDPPTPKHTLDRIDGTKGYSPDNCRWATYGEQNRNLSSNVWVGDSTLSDVARATGLSHNAIRYRVVQGLDPYARNIAERDTCKAGHPWSEENTYVAITKRKQGGLRVQKYCRACRAQHQADWRERSKQLNPKRTT